jgi:pimeloyl-ACP methyl ester carboxylesterase
LRQTLSRWSRRALRLGVLLYLSVVLMLLALQRQMLFPAPPPQPVPPSAGAVWEGRSPAGRRVVGLWSPLREGAPVIAYFHGNGMQLADCADLVPALHALDCSSWCVEYPGYGPLAGDSPSEESLVDVADGAMRLLRDRGNVPVARTVLFGQSLGTGVASALAARGAGARVVLMTPFRSIPAVASGLFPFLPVGMLVRDRFDTEALAPRITVPALVIHGTRDEVIPFAHGEALSRRLPQATLLRIEGGHHNDLWADHGRALHTALDAFIAPLR